MFKDDNTVIHFKKPLGKNLINLKMASRESNHLFENSSIQCERELVGGDWHPGDQGVERADA